MGEERQVDEISVARLWNTLDSIQTRLGAIEEKLSQVVRLEERIKTHDETIIRYGNRIDDSDKRIREIELWKASFKSEDLSKLIKDVDTIKSYNGFDSGRNKVIYEGVKWGGSITAALLIFHLTKGLI